MSPKSPTQISKAKIENHLAEGYFYADFTPTKKLSFSVGLRENIPLQNKASYLNTQIGAKYELNKKNSFLLSLGKYHSYATPNYYNKQFTVLSSQQYAFDYKFLSKNFGAKVAVYHKIEDGKQQQNAYFAIDKLKTTGIETFVTFNFAKFFKITASNLFIDQKYENNKQRFHGKYDFDYFLKFALQYSNFKYFTASIKI
ncbi:MAG: hypothetical protein CSA94_02625 [Bacteroidetes bacterium]|nr:MAG: hypothetical protein CSA94_02625 [Bacteroidota bacterium]